ncbi:MAG: hypothetical protein P8188_12690 [Gemmatimonadota bacterium]
MRGWTRRIRGALGLGLTWALGWAGIGLLIELITEFVPGWNGALVDMWPQTLAVPGFMGGAAFSLVLGIAGRRRRFDELSLPGFAAWGALGGLLVSGSIVASSGVTVPALIVSGVVTLLCAGSAVGTLALARLADDRELLAAGGDVAQVGLTDGESRELLG